MSLNDISISLVCGDALSISADVLALKYAQKYYGLDRLVSRSLINTGIDQQSISPMLNSFSLVNSPKSVETDKVIFVGVPSPNKFSYRHVREFSRHVLSALAKEAPGTKSILLTLHGIGFGLDEREAFSSEIAGLIDGIQCGDIPKSLKDITIVEANSGRAQRLRDLLSNLIPGGLITSKVALNPFGDEGSNQGLRSVGYDSSSKEHIFVAMPFKKEMDDVYHYGIQGAVNSTGYLCERADLSAFTGDVVQWVQDKISSAKLVIADLTGANPNVYLEVGFAWGKNIPVVLIADDTDTLKFDVQGQRCLKYKRIKDLEETLISELKALKESSSA